MPNRDRNHRDRELMDVEIKFGGGRVDLIKVHFDDDPYDLAEDFVERHRLKQTHVKVIANYIRDTIDQYLAEESVQHNDSYDANDSVGRNGSPARRSEDTYYRESERSSLPSESNTDRNQNSSDSSPSGKYQNQSMTDKDNDLKGPTTPVPAVGLPPLHRPAQNPRESASPLSVDVSNNKSAIPRAASESPPTIQASQQTASSMNNGSSSTPRNRINSNTSASEAIAYNRTRQNSTASVGLTRRNSEDLTPYRYGVRSPEYYLEAHDHNPDDSAFDRGAHRRNSEALQYRDRIDSTSEYSPTRRDENNSPFEKIPEVDESSSANGRNDEEDNKGLSDDDDGDEARLFQNLRDQAGMGALDEEDEEARLYEQLQRGGGRASTSVLKPVSKSLEMGKKSMLPNAPGMNNPNLINAQKKGIVGKSVSDRLHHTAELMRRKKEMMIKRAAVEEQRKLEENKFQLNQHSQDITDRMYSRYRDGDITTKLYEEGMKANEDKKTKEVEVQKQQQDIIRDWSCVKCGTFHNIPSSQASLAKWRKKEFVCSKCGWEQKDIQPFKPINVGLSLNEEASDVLKSRQNLVDEEGRGNVHEYLYHTGMQREKILHFNRELWDEINAQMPFAPTIPDSSKRILGKYKQRTTNGATSGASSVADSFQPQQQERDDMSGLSMSTHFRFNSRLTGPALKDYVNRPTVERLVQTQTRSVMDEAIMRDMMNPPAIQSSMSSIDERKKFVNRLVYEYKDKEERLKHEEDRLLSKDPVTGQKLFQPKVPEVPEEIRSGRNFSTGKGGPIWEKLVEKNKESETKKLLMQKRAIETTLKELSDNQVKALPTSNEILQGSTTKNLEELFRLLLACNEDGLVAETTHNTNHTSTGYVSSNDEEEEDKDSTVDMQRSSPRGSPTAAAAAANLPKVNTKRIHMISQSIQNWQERNLDLGVVQPALMINEVSTLLLDMKRQKIAELRKKGLNETSLSVNFLEFKDLAMKCIRFRNGPGKGYIFAPKKKPEVALQLQKALELEETFHPEIDKRSQEITRGRQESYRRVPIEDILQADGKKMEKHLEEERRKKEEKELEGLSFKPILFKTPANVVPKYRRMDLDAIDAAIAEEEQDEVYHPDNNVPVLDDDSALDKCFDDDSNDPMKDMPITLVHKMQTATSQAHPFQAGKANAAANTKLVLHSNRSNQSARSVVKAPAMMHMNYSNGGKGGGGGGGATNGRPPIMTSSGGGATPRAGGLTLHTPADVRLSRFSLPVDQQRVSPPLPASTGQQAHRHHDPSHGSTKVTAASAGRYSSEQQHQHAQQVQEEELGRGSERDDTLSWGVAPEDLVSSTQSSHQQPQMHQSQHHSNVHFDIEPEEESVQRKLHVNELAVQQQMQRSRQDKNQASAAKLPPFPQEMAGADDNNTANNSPSPSMMSMNSVSTITTEHVVHSDDDDDDDVSGALLLINHPAGGNHHLNSTSNGNLASGSQPGRGGGGGGHGSYLHRMTSSKSNRSQVSNHSLMVSRSNNSSFLSHVPRAATGSSNASATNVNTNTNASAVGRLHPSGNHHKRGGGGGGGLSVTHSANNSFVSQPNHHQQQHIVSATATAGLRSNSPPPPPPPPPPALPAASKATNAHAQAKVSSASKPAGPPPLPAELQSFGMHHPTQHQNNKQQYSSGGRMSVSSGMSTISNSSHGSTVVKKKKV